MRKHQCKNKRECHENFEYYCECKYEFLEHGAVRFYGECAFCGREGWEDFEYSNYGWKED